MIGGIISADSVLGCVVASEICQPPLDDARQPRLRMSRLDDLDAAEAIAIDDAAKLIQTDSHRPPLWHWTVDGWVAPTAG
jgi:hypothetical protein